MFWLGPNRYRGGCRDAGTNAAATNAYAYSDGDAMRAWVTYAYTHTDTYSYAYCYTYCYAYSYSYHLHPHLLQARLDHLRLQRRRLPRLRSAQGNTKASSDSASSAVKIG